MARLQKMKPQAQQLS